MEPLNLSSALFSNVQRRVLALIFGHPERSYYLSEIVRNIGSGTGAVDRELSRLERSKLVLVKRIGNQKHYRANEASPIFDELKSIMLKTSGLSEPLKQALSSHSKNIKAAFVYGSIAKGVDTAQSDIDLMVIGDDLTYTDIYRDLTKAEAFLSRHVNPNILSVKDWRGKLTRKDSFVAKISAQPKIFIIGSTADLQA